MLVLLYRLTRTQATLVRLIGFALIAWTVIAVDHHSPGASGRDLVVSISFGVATLAWAAWMTRPARFAHLTWELAAMAAAGGVLCGASPDSAASAFVFVAVVAAGVRTNFARASLVLATGVLALAGSALLFNGSALGVLAYSLGLAASLLAGTNARQSVDRADQAELLLAQQQRSHEEQLRLTRLEESTRIAREIHDVLAHALAGLVIQLEATAALIEQGTDREQILERVHRAHELAREGLEETREAVGVLRGEPISTRAALEQLVSDYRTSAEAPAALTIDGAFGRAIARITQEALTNARKHAPGAAVKVTLHAGEHSDDEVSLFVEDLPPSGSRRGSALAVSGGGYGLQGMRERAQLLGGTLEAGAGNGGWRVALRLPTVREDAE